MTFQIKNRYIGPGHPTYIIAEISCNHEQDFKKAIRLIRAAKESGADAVKFQLYTADTLTINCDNPHFQINNGTMWDGKTLYELYSESYTPWEWFIKLKEEAINLGLDFFSSAFDNTSVDFLEIIGVPCYKIASFEVCDHSLLRKIAKTGKPVIMSSGASDFDEINESVNVLRKAGCKSLCLLKCTSAYPAPPENANLKTILDMSEKFGVVTGLSDHTQGVEVPIAAVCLGASVIEKHFKLESKTSSADDSFSLTPVEFKQMVDSIRKAEKAIGSVKYKKEGQEKRNQKYKRSLFVVDDIKKGDLFTSENVRSIRPGTGLHTRYYEQIIGKQANQNILRGCPMRMDYLESIQLHKEDSCQNITAMATKKKTPEEVKEFWESRGHMGLRAGSNDINMKHLEMKVLSKYLKDGQKVLDLGCGNGVTALHLAKTYDIDITGYDYAKNMIQGANELLKKEEKAVQQRVRFEVKNIYELAESSDRYDVVITERMIINLSSWEEQKRVINEIIYPLVNFGGRFLMCEASQTGLDNLNKLRDNVGLYHIKKPWHNNYLDETKFFEIDTFSLKKHEDFSSTYYFVSRVINAWLSEKEGRHPDYDDNVNKISFLLPPWGNVGQTKLWIWDKELA